MTKYRIKEKIEANQITPENVDYLANAGVLTENQSYLDAIYDDKTYLQRIDYGYWVIQDHHGTYALSDDVFKQTYEEVD